MLVLSVANELEPDSQASNTAVDGVEPENENEADASLVVVETCV